MWRIYFGYIAFEACMQWQDQKANNGKVRETHETMKWTSALLFAYAAIRATPKLGERRKSDEL